MKSRIYSKRFGSKTNGYVQLSHNPGEPIILSVRDFDDTSPREGITSVYISKVTAQRLIKALEIVISKN